MYVVMSPNDVWFQTTVYYREILKRYFDIVSEYIDPTPFGLAPLRCPILEELLDHANHYLLPENEKFREEMSRSITHLYNNFPSKYRMKGMFDVAEGFALLAPHVEGLILFFPGSTELIQPSVEYHGIEDFVTVCYTDDITPDTLRGLLSYYNIDPANTLFVGSSPARELNAALSLGLQCSRVYYPEYITYDEATFEEVPTFDSFTAFAQAFADLAQT